MIPSSSPPSPEQPGRMTLVAELRSVGETWQACKDGRLLMLHNAPSAIELLYAAALQIEMLEKEREELRQRILNLKFDLNLVGAQLGISKREEIEPAVMQLVNERSDLRLQVETLRQENAWMRQAQLNPGAASDVTNANAYQRTPEDDAALRRLNTLRSTLATEEPTR